MRLLAILALMLGLSVPAHAAWHKASTDHFVIYADASESELRRFSSYLERYHSALELLTGRKPTKPSPSNRVTIYVVGSSKNVRTLYGEKSSRVAGFYVPRAGATNAFIPDLESGTSGQTWSTIVLLHEYAHHFTMASSSQPLPRWLNEGGAEFFASATFERDGGLRIGLPAQHRAAELFGERTVPIEELLDDTLYASKKRSSYDAFYGQAWLLYHYLVFEKAREGQLEGYVRALREGKKGLDAGRSAFGDLTKLERELDGYVRRRMMSFDLPANLLREGPIEVGALSEGAGKMMPVVMQSRRGVTTEEAQELLLDARKVAARYPDDAFVLAGLAEAEVDAGNYDLAIAAADGATARDATLIEAYVQKGYALFRKARDARDADGAYRAAMRPFSEVNKREPDHPLPLIHYYRSFAERGLPPPEQARAALERAAILAPFDQELSFNAAMMLAGEGKIELARQFLKPITQNPHGGQLARRAQFASEQMKDAPTGEPFAPDWTGFVEHIGESEDPPA